MWITTEELKDYTQINYSVANIENWIKQGQQIILNYLDMDELETGTYEEKFNGGKMIYQPKNLPITKINSIKIDDIEVDDYVYTPYLIIFDDITNDGFQNVVINYDAGFEIIPDDIKRALAIVVQNMIAYALRGLDLPNSQNIEGFSANFGKIDFIDDNVKKILDKYRKIYV